MSGVGICHIIVSGMGHGSGAWGWGMGVCMVGGSANKK